jgi:purine-binding chemotaxis protein CheW
MSGAPPLPASGLAEEMIPLLRMRLGLPDAGALRESTKPRPAILEFAELAQARAPLEAVAAAVQIQAVLFALEEEEYAARIDNVLEILRVAPIARVPEAPPHVRGVMNVRGRLLPIVEIRTILGLSPLVVDADSRVIKATIAGRLIGLLVDRVSYVVSIAENALEPPPRELGDRADFVAGVALKGDGVVLLLDLERTLSLPRSGGS